MKKWISGEYQERLVTVIVPCYNRAPIVKDTLESIWKQTYRPIELIVVDDGSTDASREVIEKWADSKQCQSDRKFKIKIIHQENGGPSMARNTGLLACKGEFIQFVDSDDILHKEKIEIQVKCIKRNDRDFSVCNYMPFGKSIEERNTIVDFFSRDHCTEKFPLEYPMDTPAPLYKRSVIVANGPWNTALKASEDFEYNFRLICRGARGVWLDHVLVYVRKHQDKERIQAAPLRKRYRYMYHGLAEMEMEALEQGLCTKKLIRNLGLRALMYYEHMKAENDGHLGTVFFNYAQSRMPFWRIALFMFQKRAWRPLWRKVYPPGPRMFLRKLARRF